MAVTRNDAVPCVDFKCAMTIYAKSRSITAVVLNYVCCVNYLSNEEDGEDNRSERLGTATANTAAATVGTTAASE